MVCSCTLSSRWWRRAGGAAARVPGGGGGALPQLVRRGAAPRQQVQPHQPRLPRHWRHWAERAGASSLVSLCVFVHAVLTFALTLQIVMNGQWMVTGGTSASTPVRAPRCPVRRVCHCSQGVSAVVCADCGGRFHADQQLAAEQRPGAARLR